MNKRDFTLLLRCFGVCLLATLPIFACGEEGDGMIGDFEEGEEITAGENEYDEQLMAAGPRVCSSNSTSPCRNKTLHSACSDEFTSSGTCEVLGDPDEHYKTLTCDCM